MGKGAIIKEGLLTDEELRRQNLASVKDKSVLPDARIIDMDNPFHETNLPRLVDTTTANIPDGLSWGIREVFFKASGTAVLTITGTNTDGNAAVWINTVTKNASGAAVYGSWSGMVAATAFIGSTTSKNGAPGLVPKPLAADVDNVLMGDGTWGLPDSVVNRINMLQDRVNSLIDALMQSANILNGTATASLLMENNSGEGENTDLNSTELINDLAEPEGETEAE